MRNRKFFVAGLAACVACLFGLASSAHADLFPPAGSYMLDGTMVLDLVLAGDFVGEPDPVDFIGTFSGQTLVQRSGSFPDGSAGGQSAIDTEIGM